MKNEYFHQRKLSRLSKLQEFSPTRTGHSCLLCLTIPTTILSNQLPCHNTKDFGKSHVYIMWLDEAMKFVL